MRSETMSVILVLFFSKDVNVHSVPHTEESEKRDRGERDRESGRKGAGSQGDRKESYF